LKNLNYKDIRDFFLFHKIKANDVIFIHGNAAVISQMIGKNKNEKIKNFWQSFIKFFSNKGTVIVPTFSYSLTKKKIFNPKVSKSVLGLFSETFQKLKNTKRSYHPIFSVSYFGKLSKEIIGTSNETCFGKKSLFEFLHKKNAKILCLGCSYNQITFVHYIEEMLKINYRYFKRFKGYHYYKNKKKIVETDYFVRDLSLKRSTLLNLKKLFSNLKNKKKYFDFPLGRIPAHSVSTNDLFFEAKKGIKKNQFFLIG
tara:strand:- start:658 stop:1422 length:765 start_codon:yes stop_codon:yes gene_type:complete